MIPLPPLFADVNPVGIIVVIIFVISLISQIVAKLHEKVQEASREAERRARAAQRAAAARNEQVDNEIGEFLRRTSGRRDEQGRPQPQQQAPQQPVPQRRPEAQRPFTPPAQPAFAPPPLPSSQEAVAAEVVAGASVEQHVQRYLSAAKLGQLGPELQSKVETTDERMKEHLQKAFQHQVGNLAAKPIESLPKTAAESGTPLGALALAAMLRDPSGARQAILLNEILSRPEHRWS